jgi:hypothetical protein
LACNKFAGQSFSEKKGLGSVEQGFDTLNLRLWSIYLDNALNLEGYSCLASSWNIHITVSQRQIRIEFKNATSNSRSCTQLVLRSSSLTLEPAYWSLIHSTVNRQTKKMQGGVLQGIGKEFVHLCDAGGDTEVDCAVPDLDDETAEDFGVDLGFISTSAKNLKDEVRL